MRIVPYIAENLRAEADNFVLLVPVFMGVGAGMYFHRAAEPGFWPTAFAFAASAFMLMFVNFGNSSDKVKEYKKMFAFSTFVFFLKKLIKIFVFAILFPLLGQAAIVMLAVSFLSSILGYLKFLKYFSFIFRNQFFGVIFGFARRLFRPVMSFM
ncbi:MAG: hypothetical protein LBO78_03570, partial [Rickettsiales bacterium]|nr:hypothetical protein [Rickettsiales bacterium]